MDQPAQVVFCNCSYAEVVPPDVKRAVLRKLSDSGVTFEAVADLCEMSARKDPAVRRLAAGGNVRIAACFPRAVQWLFHAGDAPLPVEDVKVFNMREQSAEDVVTGLLADAAIDEEPR